MLARSNRRSATLAMTAALAVFVCSTPASADQIIYENLPTGLANPPYSSTDILFGSVIAEDFVPIAAGVLQDVTWWGGPTPSSIWRIYLQDNDPVLGAPALTPPGNTATGGVPFEVVAVGVPYAPLPGVFEYTADISSLNFAVAPATDYWITIAARTFVGETWYWAEALDGPAVGSNDFTAHASVGQVCLNGGPHCGPWHDTQTHFAVELTTVPEPGTLTFFATGLIAMGFKRLRPYRLGQIALGPGRSLLSESTATRRDARLSKVLRNDAL